MIKRMTLRLPAILHERLKELAKENQFSLHQYITLILIDHIAPGTVLQPAPEESEASLAIVDEYIDRRRRGASEAELEALAARFRAENEAKVAQDTQEREPVAAD